MPRTSRLPAQREIAAEPEDLVLRLLGSLRAIADPRGAGRSKAVTRPAGAAQPTRPLDRCEPPRSDAPPQFSVDYTRLILAPTIRAPAGPEQPVIEPGGGFMPVVDLACVGTKLDVNVALTLTFRQTWNLLGTFIGDLSSTMGLAPSEQLTLEFVSSQRRLLEKLTVDSREEITTRENTTLDKEVMNVAHSSSRTEKWGVNGKGSFSLGFITLGAGADVSGTTMTAAQDSTQNIAEATEKSARTLKTLQKVEVRGVNETFVSNRVVRTIKNPYPDRTMAMNVYQLVKRFAVETCLAELRPALVITLNELEFNAGFIARHRAFLREALLDPSLLEEVDRLAIAVEGSMDAKGDSVQATATAARESAKLALRYLFEEPNIFSLPVNPRIRSRRGQPINPNRPATSFSASLPSEIDYSGFGDSQARDLIDIFVTTAWFYDLYRTLQAADQIDEEAASLVTSLAAAVEPRVQSLITGADSNVLAVMDNQALTEVFRRLPGFLATVKGMVQPRIDAAEAARATRDLQSEAIRATRALVDHLACHQAHYTQRFLAYLAERSDNAMIVDFVKQVIESRGPLYGGVFDVVDVERSYLDRTAIIVPGFRGVSETPMERLVAIMDGGRRATVQECEPVVSEVEVPCDGVHLEVAPGTCVLPDVPVLVEAVAAD